MMEKEFSQASMLPTWTCIAQLQGVAVCTLSFINKIHIAEGRIMHLFNFVQWAEDWDIMPIEFQRSSSALYDIGYFTVLQLLSTLFQLVHEWRRSFASHIRIVYTLLKMTREVVESQCSWCIRGLLRMASCTKRGKPLCHSFGELLQSFNVVPFQLGILASTDGTAPVVFLK